ncbi:related to UTP5 protein [Rhynchosporium agropyri]|uniref:Related to UTP5 protein n=1 Tax=Rhynchosporium agropyri TaxID=914238 RepID=A0A1E1KXB3_9HELO|nr:related to UTP5 protein [Rhynchosporium agropyri]
MATKRKLPLKIGLPAMKQSAKPLGKITVDDSRAVISGGGYATKTANGVVDISSDSSSDDAVEETDAEDAESAAGEDVAMEDAQDTADPSNPNDEDNDEELAEPSFGDRIQALADEPIDVAAAFEDPSQALTYPNGAPLQPPSGASLGTVLSQALKTNDVALLESCLQTTDLNTIRATIQRLDSPLAGILLQKIADRLFKRPGRAGSLMVWVQWTSVTHGGYLATQRDLIKKLAELDRVVDGRSTALRPVLALKGKLDMMGAQVEYRRSLQDQRRRSEEDEEDEGVIYVEGEESNDESGAKLLRDGAGPLSDPDSEMSDDMPMTNGVGTDSEEESSDEDNLLDDEAEETDADSGDEDENDDDSRGEEEEDDSGVESPPAKKTKSVFSKK